MMHWMKIFISSKINELKQNPIFEEQNTGNDSDLSLLACMGGINPTLLNPFQTIRTLPLPLSLVSISNRYCEF
jgi:hypothetical protein